MKKHKLFYYLIAVLLVYSCTGDDDIDNTLKLGLLKSVETFYGSELLEITEISYDEQQRLTSLRFLQGNFSTDIYDVTYNDGEVRSITRTGRWHPQHADETWVSVFDVAYQNNEIILTSRDSENIMVFVVSDGYVDSFTNYYGENDVYIDESVFKRDENNNIESISYYATNPFDTHLLVWQYAYSNYDTKAKLNSAYNPVFYYSYSLYQPFIGALLNLKISNLTPLRSSPLNANYLDDVTAEILVDDNGLLKKCFFEYSGSPTDDLYLEFDYY